MVMFFSFVILVFAWHTPTSLNASLAEKSLQKPPVTEASSSDVSIKAQDSLHLVQMLAKTSNAVVKSSSNHRVLKENTEKVLILSSGHVPSPQEDSETDNFEKSLSSHSLPEEGAHINDAFIFSSSYQLPREEVDINNVFTSSSSHLLPEEGGDTNKSSKSSPTDPLSEEASTDDFVVKLSSDSRVIEEETYTDKVATASSYYNVQDVQAEAYSVLNAPSDQDVLGEEVDFDNVKNTSAHFVQGDEDGGDKVLNTSSIHLVAEEFQFQSTPLFPRTRADSFRVHFNVSEKSKSVFEYSATSQLAGICVAAL